MTSLPRISLVVPVRDSAGFLGDALQSLVEQAYPSLEVIVQDGGSSDGSAEIADGMARAHPGTFRVFVEQDSGPADALNRGFARASGDVLGYLCADDLMMPGTLHGVAAEMAPGRGRQVVMGRSCFLVEGMPGIGVENPARFIGRFDHLAVWKRGFHILPQPPVFWHREAWSRIGGLPPAQGLAYDYELVCRLARDHPIHLLDSLWGASRLHAASATAQCTERELQAMWLATSRRHWGPWRALLRWRCEASWWLHQRHAHDQARHHARLAETALATGRRGGAIVEMLRTWVRSPAMAMARFRRP